MGFFLPVIGIAAGAVSLAAAMTVLPLDPVLAVFAVFAAQYLAFNLFHFDGLLDTADAFLCYAGRERRLEILKDSRIGVFAFLTGCIYLGLKAYLLYRLIALFGPAAGAAPETSMAVVAGTEGPAVFRQALLVFTYPVTGRAAAALVPCLTRPARKEGLGAALADYSRTTAAAGMILAVLLPTAAGALLGGGAFTSPAAAPGAAVGAIAAALGVLLAGGGTAALYRHRAGGFTGDALGAAVELGELIHLLMVFIGLKLIGT
jgi:adenosylcobinamide-GDP ribazoletransferase